MVAPEPDQSTGRQGPRKEEIWNKRDEELTEKKKKRKKGIVALRNWVIKTGEKCG